MSILSDLQTKKLGLLELIAMGCDLYLKHFRSFFILLCVVLPFSIILQFLSLNLSSNSLLLIPFSIYYVFYLFVIIPAYTMALCIFTEGYVLGENPQIDVVTRKILSRLMLLVGLNIRYTIGILLRFLLLFIPGIIYYVNNSYCTTAFVLRDQRGKAAFQYSRSLIKGNWWKVFFFTTLVLMACFGLQELTSTVLNSIITNSRILVAVFSNILTSLVLGGVGISGVLLFLNLDFQKQ
jgi:hypothetical protein